LRYKEINGSESLVIPGEQDIKKLAIIPDLRASDRLDLILLAEIDKIPDIAGVVDIG